ncbi:MAG: GTP-binding protein [Lachnospiraceae bacterium]|nr:GTP-binding protein [Lachnospiraceae bacterium]
MRDLLKFITCGSVDDGKSTLIGHILYDSKLLYADQEKALLLDSKVGSRGGEIDYSLLLDGLTEEREQGITIDVAYRYFTTDNRSFIVADTPGHEEYTRNMAVGASFAELAVILIDASKGVLIQTRRHARIASLMGIRHFVFAVNKMDLVGYSEERFHEIEGQIAELVEELSLANVAVIPVSATAGDYVTKASDNMPWYQGETLLAYLENVDVDEESEEEGFFLPVQRVCRPDHTFRGFEGQIEAGSVSVGDQITTYPSRETARVKSILAAAKETETAVKGQPVTVTLDREVDTSRGCVLAKDTELPVTDAVEATVLWMDDTELTSGKNFFVKLGTRLIPGIVTEILYRVDVNTGARNGADRLAKNEIARVKIAFTEKIVVDLFKKHRNLGELILIDRISYMTSACGVVEELSEQDARFAEGKVTKELRAALAGQTAVTVEFRIGEAEDRISLERVQEIEKALVVQGRHTYLYKPESDEHLEEVTRRLNHAGIVILLALTEELEAKNPVAKRAEYIPDPGWKEKSDEEIVKAILKASAYDADVSDREYI